MVLSDEELIQRYRATKDAAEASARADELLRRYSLRVVSWCWRFSDDREAAMDLGQEVLLKAYQHLASFRSDARFSTWLYSITRNHCLNFVRNRTVEPVAIAETLDTDPQDCCESNVLESLERKEEMEKLRYLMAQALDKTEEKVMLLHYGEELPLEGITRLLGLTNQSGAKAYIVSAKRKLSIAVRRWRAGTTGREKIETRLQEGGC